MPRRLLHLSWYRRNEYRILAAIILYGIMFLFYAQHQQADEIRSQSQKADARFQKISQENQARSLAASASAYASCRRQQEVALIQREFYNLVLPPLSDLHPTIQVRIREFRRDVRAHHILDIPVCQKPPKDGS